MCSAFKRGIELLSEQESDSVQSQRNSGDGESSTLPVPEHIEGVVRVPKNVTQLKPLIQKLMRKVIVIAI
jgi:hypothetical protein